MGKAPSSNLSCYPGTRVGTGYREGHGRLLWLGRWASGRVGWTVGSSLRGGEGALHLVGGCPRGDRLGMVVVERDRWLRLQSLRGYGGEAMESEVRFFRLVKRPLSQRSDQREMVLVVKGRWLPLLILPWCEGEVMGCEVR